MNRDLESALDALVNIVRRQGAWAVEARGTPEQLSREVARLAAELGGAKRTIRTLFDQRVDMPEISDVRPVGLG